MLQGINIQELSLFTKSYSEVKQLAYLKQVYGEHYLFVKNQLSLLDKANSKLPDWVGKGCYFTKQSLEQCSSPATAKFKASLIKGDLLVDLSAGLGVDDVFFGNGFKQVIGVDSDETLNTLVNYNLGLLGVSNVKRYTAAAQDFICQLTDTPNWFFIDADRRANQKLKSVILEDGSPNVMTLLPAVLTNNSGLMLKLSPLVDIAYLKNKLTHLTHIYVVAVKNEVKELLCLLQLNGAFEGVTAIDLNDEGLVQNEYSSNHSFVSFNDAVSRDYNTYQWFYNPGAALIKTQLVGVYHQQHKLNQVATKSTFALASHKLDGYFGKVYKIVTCCEFSKNTFKSYLKHHHISKANFAVKNFVSKADELKKVFSIQDGGEDYFFFTTNEQGIKLVFHTKKV